MIKAWFTGPYGPKQSSKNVLMEFKTLEEFEQYRDMPNRLHSFLKMWEDEGE